MIPDAPVTDEQPAKPDSSASQDVLGRYRSTGFFRWYPVVMAVASVVVGTGQFVDTIRRMTRAWYWSASQSTAGRVVRGTRTPG